MFDFLSQDWFAHGVPTLPHRSGIDARLQFEARTETRLIRWVLCIAEGQVSAWRLGDLQDPDVEICWSIATAYQVFARQLSGTQATLDTLIREDRRGESYLGPPPPFDFATEHAPTTLPEIPGLKLTVQYDQFSCPFGDVSAYLVFTDGNHVDIQPGPAASPDVKIGLSYRNMILHRQGVIRPTRHHEIQVFVGAIVIPLHVGDEGGPHQCLRRLHMGRVLLHEPFE